jgi:ABC-type antimicrobial peptide transport system permease subunit
MSSTRAPSAAPASESSGSGVAPAWHTAVLLVWLLGISFIGAHVDLAHGHVVTYSIAILMEWTMVLLISIYGACFGVFARWRRSLRPGILAHALQDTAGGLLGFLTR